MLTNRASSSPPAVPPPPPSQPPITPSQPLNPSPAGVPPRAPAASLVEKIRAAEDKTLKRLAPVTISPTRRPRVLIPDSEFEKGAELHKDFIICFYNGKAPPFNQIQSVFNHLWGKGKRLEIHNNPLNRTTIVRIQSEYLRQKILEKCVWYVGDTMFHTALWSKVRSLTAPPIKTLRIWAHLTGVPLDLRHQAGLSLVAGLVGEPKETDDFTKNMVSLTLSHVKVEVDLTQPLPSVVEFERQSGEVVEVSVHYPWVPPTCSHCKELGHIARNCLTYTPPAQDSEEDPPSATSKTAKKKQSKIYRPVNPSADNPTPSTQPPLNGSKGLLATPSVSVTTPPLLNPPPPSVKPSTLTSNSAHCPYRSPRSYGRCILLS